MHAGIIGPSPPSWQPLAALERGRRWLYARLMADGRGEVTRSADGIVRIVNPPGHRLGVAEINYFIAEQRRLGEGRKVPVLIDGRGVVAMSKEARQIGAGPDYAAITSRMAIVVGGPVSAMIGTFFFRVARPSFPVRLFSDFDAAVTWLRSAREGTPDAA
jgi:hypothetical protein